jgi:hypothetical protein
VGDLLDVTGRHVEQPVAQVRQGASGGELITDLWDVDILWTAPGKAGTNEDVIGPAVQSSDRPSPTVMFIDVNGDGPALALMHDTFTFFKEDRGRYRIRIREVVTVSTAALRAVVARSRNPTR